MIKMHANIISTYRVIIVGNISATTSKRPEFILDDCILWEN